MDFSLASQQPPPPLGKGSTPEPQKHVRIRYRIYEVEYLGWMSRGGYGDDNENGLAFSRSFDWVE
jgi:hypothetical protein